MGTKRVFPTETRNAADLRQIRLQRYVNGRCGECKFNERDFLAIIALFDTVLEAVRVTYGEKRGQVKNQILVLVIHCVTGIPQKSLFDLVGTSASGMLRTESLVKNSALERV